MIMPLIIRSFTKDLCRRAVNRRLLPLSFVRHHSYDPDGKTTITVLNKNTEGLMINSYSQLGFRLNNGVYVLGPMAIFPRTVLSWNISSVDEVNEDSLSLFCLLEPKIDILVLGAGDMTSYSNLNRKMLGFMSKYRINIEVLTTEQACTTFNFLNAENRYVAGAMIPPVSLQVTDDDIFLTKMRQKRLYGSGDDNMLWKNTDVIWDRNQIDGNCIQTV